MLKRLLARLKGSFQEKRQSARRNLAAPLEVCFFDERGHGFESGEVLDLSAAGMRFKTPIKVRAGVPITIMFYFPGAYGRRRPLKLPARVVRCYRERGQTHYRVGCSFKTAPASAIDDLSLFLDWQGNINPGAQT